MQNQKTAIIQEWVEDKNGKLVPFVFCHVCGKDLTGTRALDIRPGPNGEFSRKLKSFECLCDECKSDPNFHVAEYTCNQCNRTFFTGENQSVDPFDSIEAHNHFNLHICPDCNPKNRKVYIRSTCSSCGATIIDVISPSEQERRMHFPTCRSLCKNCQGK